MEEIELSEQCRLGNNRARKELYEQYAGRMLGICLRYTGDRDTAQDLLHDGFLKIFDSFDKFTWRGEGSLRAWLLPSLHCSDNSNSSILLYTCLTYKCSKDRNTA